MNIPPIRAIVIIQIRSGSICIFQYTSKLHLEAIPHFPYNPMSPGIVPHVVLISGRKVESA
jgi:hypothetical protein